MCLVTKQMRRSPLWEVKKLALIGISIEELCGACKRSGQIIAAVFYHIISYTLLLILEVNPDGDSSFCASAIWLMEQGRVCVVQLKPKAQQPLWFFLSHWTWCLWVFPLVSLRFRFYLFAPAGFWWCGTGLCQTPSALSAGASEPGGTGVRGSSEFPALLGCSTSSERAEGACASSHCLLLSRALQFGSAHGALSKDHSCVSVCKGDGKAGRLQTAELHFNRLSFELDLVLKYMF